MKDYSDPGVWKDFLLEHGFDAAIKVPPQQVVEAAAGVSEDKLSASMLAWARARDPAVQEQVMREEYLAIEALRSPVDT
jgi:hypothetical protein